MPEEEMHRSERLRMLGYECPDESDWVTGLHPMDELLRGERTPRYGKVAFRPNADVYYDKSQKVVVVKLELPGIDPQAVDLEIDENVLRVSGVRSYQHHPDAVYQQMEITYGRFERVVALPPEVDSGQATAHYSSGYLEISLRNGSAARQLDTIVGDEVTVIAAL